MTERELLVRIAEEDDDALEQLYRAYYPRLARFLLRLNLSREEAEEVINDIFLVVWQKSGAFRGDSTPSTWIMGIAHNKALKCLKRHKFVEPLGGIADPSTVVPDPTLDIFTAVRRLPAKHRAVVVLTFEFGYSYREIAEILGCPENTVKTRMFNARKSLKAMLET